MKIFLTLDYEIFFGNPTGSAEKCVIEPTEKLMQITERTGVPMTYFIDIGYVLQLEKYKSKFRRLTIDLEKIKDQIVRLVEQGNDCQLHIHPHWEDAFFDGKAWQIDPSRYKLTDFEDGLLAEICVRYKEGLELLTKKPVTSYRAGGWCLQPFERLAPIFEDMGIKIDSTVFPGGYKDNDVYYYDFRQTPQRTRWRFKDDLTRENAFGPFLELPIAAHTYKPFFFWKLFGWGRIKPSQHKPLGNGKPLPSGGGKRQFLTRRNRLPVSLDGYFAKKLSGALGDASAKRDGEDFVVIGHPKACTLYSLKQLELFIVQHKEQHQFQTFNQVEFDQ